MPTRDLPRHEIELAILQTLLSRALSKVAPNSSECAELGMSLEQLSGYAWSDQEHRVVYESLRAARRTRVIPLRQQMAAEATRMGHPDVEWSLYFRVPALPLDLAALQRALKSAKKDDCDSQ